MRVHAGGEAIGAADWPAAERQLRQLFEQGKLDDAGLIKTLGSMVPRYAGSHAGVLANQAFLQDLDQMIR